MKNDETKNPTQLLVSWDRRALKALDAHYETARLYARMNSTIGIPTVILAAAISGLAFATVGSAVPLWVQLCIGFLALIQTVLASLHTWLRHSEVAEKHRQAGSRYAAIRRHIEELLSYDNINQNQAAGIRQSLDTVSREAPSLPARIWRRTQMAYKGHGTAAGKILSPETDDVKKNKTS